MVFAYETPPPMGFDPKPIPNTNPIQQSPSSHTHPKFRLLVQLSKSGKNINTLFNKTIL